MNKHSSDSENEPLFEVDFNVDKINPAIQVPKIFRSFKHFISKSITFELVVGLVIAASLQAVLTSFLTDIILPVTLGVIFGRDLENIFVILKGGANGTTVYDTVPEARNDGAVTLNIGIFVTRILNFVVMVISLWIIVKMISVLAKSANLEDKLTSKDCQFCYKSMATCATRCPFCTSNVE